jgi:predicted DNA-binding transcriptional regulator AlpA
MSCNALEDRLWNSKEVSQVLGMSVKTICLWRSKGTGPAYMKVGGAIRYRAKDVFLYLENRRISTETQK